jgi:hypothetical protein
LLVGDAVVVGQPALGGDPQLVQDLGRAAERELVARPSRRASSHSIHQSVRASPGGSTALLYLITRPSPLVTRPSSSAQTVLGRTTSARAAVSDRKKSDLDVELKRVVAGPDHRLVGQGHERVVAHAEQPADLAGGHLPDHLVHRGALVGQVASSIPQTPAT